jgi:hypothetical protein
MQRALQSPSAFVEAQCRTGAVLCTKGQTAFGGLLRHLALKVGGCPPRFQPGRRIIRFGASWGCSGPTRLAERLSRSSAGAANLQGVAGLAVWLVNTLGQHIQQLLCFS